MGFSEASNSILLKISIVRNKYKYKQTRNENYRHVTPTRLVCLLCPNLSLSLSIQLLYKNIYVTKTRKKSSVACSIYLQLQYKNITVFNLY